MTCFQSIYFDHKPQTGRIIDLFPAPNPAHDIALFFIHGGGWKGGSRTIFHTIIHQYRQLGFDCASTDYRLSVDVEQQVSDIRTGMNIFIGDQARRNRPTKLLLIGSSAGAHLALLTGLAKPEEYGASNEHYSAPAQIAGIAVQAAPFVFGPWEDIFPGSWTAMIRAIGKPYEGNEELYRKACPTSYITPGNPAIFSLYSENEYMFPREMYVEFAERSQPLGNRVEEKIYPRTEHGFFYDLDRWQQQEAFEDIKNFALSL